jgi:ferredoxin-NADP reductase
MMNIMMNTDRIRLKIVRIIDETSDTKSFILDAVEKPIRYRAGQFITLVLRRGENEERRSYSMSSSPEWGEPLTITVKRVVNGEFSRYLYDTCREGDVLNTIGASGFFTLPEDTRALKHLFFFAAGSGITPIFSLIKTALLQTDLVIHLIYSSRAPQSTIFYEALNKLQQQFADRFHLEYYFSSSQNLMRARFGKLQLTDYLHQYASANLQESLFYVCGPHEYMQMITITLLREGVLQAQVRKEIFDVIKPVIKELPPDTRAHEVTIRHRQQEYRLTVQYPLTILQAAKEKGIPLPYSCEAGKCGTCAASCTKGAVWMSYNEVLLDSELAQGRVLTCVGYPIKGDVVLEFPALT